MWSFRQLVLLLSRIKELEKQLDQAQLRAVGFETMIEIAEKELRIEIRKKSVTKQSK
jgi:transposase